MACKICNSGEEKDDYHQTTSEHRFNFALRDFEIAKKRLKSNRHGIELNIEVEPLNGFQYDFSTTVEKGSSYLSISTKHLNQHNNEIKFLCKLKNVRTRNLDPIVLTYCGLLHPYQAFNMDNAAYGFKEFEPGAEYIFRVGFKLDQSHVSNYKIPIYFSIQTISSVLQKMQMFSIAKSITVAVYDDELILDEELDVKSPFMRSKWEKTKIIPPKYKFPMVYDYVIPTKYMNALFIGLQTNRYDGSIKRILDKLEPGYVTVEKYEDFYHILLWLEETCEIIGLSCYNMENVHLKYKSGDVLELVVPGLAEKRPSIIKGDTVEIKVHGDHTSYEGVVERIEDQVIHIQYLDDIILDLVYNNPEMDMDVRFHLGRVHLERMHMGVHNVFASGYVRHLFPDISLSKIPVKRRYKINKDNLSNKDVYSNPEQLIAVENILNNTSRGAPYLVYGPPGTGKTVTIVESIYQLKIRSKKKIMICAPSNAACNMLTEKLARFCDPNELIRIISPNADLSSVHNSIIKYCNIYSDNTGMTILPVRFTDLHKYTIIVTTLVLAGKFTGSYQPDILFIDEAAQAREPEACCAIGLLSYDKQLILSGDPQQLGPVVHSQKCISYGYNVSLFERLYSLPVYQNNTDFMTMLKLNFRSNKHIINIPNRLFYNNHLKAVSKESAMDPICGVFVYKLIVNDQKAVNHKSPIEFCAIISKEQRQGRSPSYYNNREILMVNKYVEKLTSINFGKTSAKIEPCQIGVVTPYIRQVYKIRESLRNQKRKWAEIEVGTAEAFQGREKRIIIISTVRAQEDLLLYDQRYKLGFVKEPKRFNVAVTRAKSKLIVIGNPLVLHTDLKFRALMEQAKEMGTFCGAPFTPRTGKVRDDILKRFSNLHITDKQSSV